MSLAYALEKLSDTVRILKKKKGNPRLKLKEASTEYFVRLSSEDIPSQALEDYTSIRERLTSVESVTQGSFYASIDAMSEEEVNRLIEDIISFEAKMMYIWKNR